jgi:hypothetical protein
MMTIHAPARSTRLSTASVEPSVSAGGILRGLAAAGVLLSADVHFDLWYAGGFRDIRTIGPLFLLNAIGGLLVGVAVLVWRHWLPAVAAAGFGAATLIAFYLSINPGLFGLHETASGEPQVLAEISEYVALLFGMLAAGYGWRRRR